jgi:hypothetical protein
MTLVENLRSLARRKHDDLSIADEAAAEIEALRKVLGWYEERARLGRTTDDASGVARYEMVQDGGFRARAILNINKE